VRVRLARITGWSLLARRVVAPLVFSGVALLIGSHSLQNAVADGETRTLSLHHAHTGEALTITYKRDGRYDEAALQKLNWLLRDWRREQQTQMDPHLFDVIWEVYRDVGAKETIEVVCGYRSPETNAMLRHRSRHTGVAQFSQHMLGRAMDFYIPGVALEDVRVAGLRLQRGGVGFYPTSGSPFVHLDTGNVRHWPRMTHDQLVRVFPDGKTVHVPSDGHPLARYAVALAEIERRGGSASATSLAEAGADGVNTGRDGGAFSLKHSFLARLFGYHDQDEDADQADARSAPATTPAPALAKPQLASVIPVPMVRPKRPNGFALASVPTSPADDPASIVNARGIWAPAPSPSSLVAASHAANPSAPAPAATRGAIGTVGQRFVWITGPQGRIASADSSPRVAVRSVDADEEGTASVQMLAMANREDHDVALAYAATPAPAPALDVPARPAAMGSLLRTKPNGTLTVPPARRTLLLPGERIDDPWLRSVVMAPSIQDTMRVSVLGPTDYRSLEPLMAKPRSAVAMGFSLLPQFGLVSQNFEGAAVAFLPTVTFAPSRAAALN
jgi:uncharacterized protein YcbK (DUF882 family)